MKQSKLTFLLLAGLLAASLAAAQTTHTVNNNPGAVAMFDNFADAYDMAAPGDTILLQGSANYYGSHTVHKRLRIEGPGYFLSENAVPGVSSIPARIQLSLVNDPVLGDPSGSVLVGLSLKGHSDDTPILDVGISGVVFDKVLFESGSLFESPVIIRRSFYQGLEPTRPLVFYNGASGSSITNSNLGHLTVRSRTQLSIDRSILREVSEFGNSYNEITITNSILLGNHLIFSPTSSLSIAYCIATEPDLLPAGGNNLNGQALTGTGGIFEAFGGENSDIAVLRADSPALGAGTGGSDIGIYGGATPYVPGGVPARPRISVLSVPTAANDSSGLTFDVEAEGFGD